MVGDHGPGHWNDGEARHDNALLQMLVPTDVLQSNPHILANLKANEDRRLGPYDVYEVLHWIATGGVSTAERPLRKLNKTAIDAQEYFQKGRKNRWGTDPTRPPKGNTPRNFFVDRIAKNRTCEDAGIALTVQECT